MSDLPLLDWQPAVERDFKRPGTSSRAAAYAYPDGRPNRKGKRCSIQGCGQAFHGRGYCKVHYLRWMRHGDPAAGGSYHGARRAEIQKAIQSAAPDKCWEWPFDRGRRGYGALSINGQKVGAHRHVCTLVHGERGGEFHAAHTCGNGHLGCINPHHLEWKTAKENAEDTVRHGRSLRGERSAMAKLTEAAVLQIRAAYARGGVTQRELAEVWGVSGSAIFRVVNGIDWGWLQPAERKNWKP